MRRTLPSAQICAEKKMSNEEWEENVLSSEVLGRLTVQLH